jgi:hypothetical protein
LSEQRSAAEARARSLAVAENLTLWTLLAAVSLFAAGQISHTYELNALGLRSLRVDEQWQDRVYEGGLGLLNTVLMTITQPRFMHLPWVLATGLFVVCLWRRRVSTGRARVALGIFAACAYLAAIIAASIGWGTTLAQLVRDDDTREHFVFAPDALPRLPPPLLQENEERKLKLVFTTSDFVVLLNADGKTSYRIATRDVELQESTRP